jgi:hypothetical protein
VTGKQLELFPRYSGRSNSGAFNNMTTYGYDSGGSAALPLGGESVFYVVMTDHPQWRVLARRTLTFDLNGQKEIVVSLGIPRGWN